MMISLRGVRMVQYVQRRRGEQGEEKEKGWAITAGREMSERMNFQVVLTACPLFERWALAQDKLQQIMTMACHAKRGVHNMRPYRTAGSADDIKQVPRARE